jgi:para-aminobenzoate synthetase/4-amino-4-deoxychorismate lyase
MDDRTLARFTRVQLRGLPGPAEVARALWHEPHPVLLTGAWAGGGALFASSPLALSSDPWALAAQPRVEGDAPATAVGGGWFGVIGYDEGRRYEPTVPPPPPGASTTRLAFYDNVLHQDAEGRWWFEALETPEREQALRRRAAQLQSLEAVVPPVPGGLRDVRWRAPGAAGHGAAVQEATRRIAAGELYQANLAMTLEARTRDDELTILATGLERLRPAYGAALPGIASFSPELFLRRTGRTVHTAPVKGTGREREPLLASAKDAAEHVMIVDLMRNDLGRVCEYGSVTADRRPRAQPEVGVWHLVSDVSGTLRPSIDDGDLLAATFPPGSVTGAPKVRAMRVIGELEPLARDAFCGAIGHAGPLTGLELSVAIRTFERDGDRIRLQVGGAVVADSTPAGEVRECEQKAAPLLAALGARIPPASRRTHRNLPRALDHGSRPDPRRGLIETVGELAELPAHLERLRSSAAELYGLDLRALPAPPPGEGRLRVELDPRERRPRMAWRPHIARPPVTLAPFVLPGGLGRHKWRDRELLDRLTAHARATPLLLDADGEVLEAAWAAVAIAEGDALIAPPGDDRRLTSITLAALAPAAVREPFDLARLQSADAVVLFSALARRTVVHETSLKQRIS